MYLEWVKKHFRIILAFHFILMITTMIVNGPKMLYVEFFLLSALFFGVLLYFYYRFLANRTSGQAVINILGADIILIGVFIVSLFGVHDGLISIGFWGLVPFRTLKVFYCKKFNIVGTDYLE